MQLQLQQISNLQKPVQAKILIVFSFQLLRTPVLIILLCNTTVWLLAFIKIVYWNYIPHALGLSQQKLHKELRI
jgi:hypothetical protein